MFSHSGFWLCFCRHETQRYDVEPVQCEPTHLFPIQPPSPDHPLSPVKLPSPTEPLSPTQPLSPTHPLSLRPSPSSIAPSSLAQPSSSPPIQHPSISLTLPTQPRTFKLNNPPPSRLHSSLLRYTPVQYSRFLDSRPSQEHGTFSYIHPSESEAGVSPVQPGEDELDAQTSRGTPSIQEESTSSLPSSQPRSGVRVYTPFMKLMEMTAKINID